MDDRLIVVIGTRLNTGVSTLGHVSEIELLSKIITFLVGGGGLSSGKAMSFSALKRKLRKD